MTSYPVIRILKNGKEKEVFNGNTKFLSEMFVSLQKIGTYKIIERAY